MKRTATMIKPLALTALALFCVAAQAAPTVSRLTPPSELFASGRAAPVVARFLPGQRFDLQATIRPDDATRAITSARFEIDGKPVAAPLALRDCATGCVKGVPVNAAIVSVRAVEVMQPGLHQFSVSATQSDGQSVVARGNFEIVALLPGEIGRASCRERVYSSV